MTYDEALVIMGILKTAYPSYYRDMRRDEAEKTVSLWVDLFAGDEPTLVAAAVKSFIAADTKGFPPAIGQIKAELRALLAPDELSEQEAWNIVAKAVDSYDAAKNFDKLPPLIQKIVGSPSVLRNWGQTDIGDFNTVIASNFQRSYRAAVLAERKWSAVPEDVRRLTGRGCDRPALE